MGADEHTQTQRTMDFVIMLARGRMGLDWPDLGCAGLDLAGLGWAEQGGPGWVGLAGWGEAGQVREIKGRLWALVMERQCCRHSSVK